MKKGGLKKLAETLRFLPCFHLQTLPMRSRLVNFLRNRFGRAMVFFSFAATLPARVLEKRGMSISALVLQTFSVMVKVRQKAVEAAVC